jgi:bacterioferritin (cytochrome b1)
VIGGSCGSNRRGETQFGSKHRTGTTLGRSVRDSPRPARNQEEPMSNLSTRELQEKIAAELKEWQKTEGAAAQFMDKLGKDTDHPVLKAVADIIHADSLRHARIQQLIVDSLEKTSITLSPEDVSKVWATIEAHIATERDMVKNVRNALELMKGRKMVVQQYLLEYLLFDEEKHDLLLEKLEGVKRGMYPYG